MTRRLLPEQLKRLPSPPSVKLRDANRDADLEYFRAKYDANHPDAPHVAAIIRQLERGTWGECEVNWEEEE